MAERFTSDAIELPPANRPFERADLIFYGIDHSGPSYEARVFFDPRGVSRGRSQSDPAWMVVRPRFSIQASTCEPSPAGR